MSEPIRFHADGGGDAVCSICQTSVVAGEPMVRCPSCSIPLHAECWTENRGCSVYGCQAAPKTDDKATPAAADLAATWDEDKNCPSCGRKIRGRALRCRHCGAAFGSREAMTREQFHTREYQDQEYRTARTTVFTWFLLSATGCLSPVTLFATGALIWGGKLGKLEYRRLPSVLQTMVKCAFAVNCLLTVLMVLLVTFDSR